MRRAVPRVRVLARGRARGVRRDRPGGRRPRARVAAKVRPVVAYPDPAARRPAPPDRGARRLPRAHCLAVSGDRARGGRARGRRLQQGRVVRLRGGGPARRRTLGRAPGPRPACRGVLALRTPQARPRKRYDARGAFDRARGPGLDGHEPVRGTSGARRAAPAPSVRAVRRRPREGGGRDPPPDGRTGGAPSPGPGPRRLSSRTRSPAIRSGSTGRSWRSGATTRGAGR